MKFCVCKLFKKLMDKQKNHGARGPLYFNRECSCRILGLCVGAIFVTLCSQTFYSCYDGTQKTNTPSVQMKSLHFFLPSDKDSLKRRLTLFFHGLYTTFNNYSLNTKDKSTPNFVNLKLPPSQKCEDIPKFIDYRTSYNCQRMKGIESYLLPFKFQIAKNWYSCLQVFVVRFQK